MSALQELLDAYFDAAKTEREKGTYFEELCRTYFRNEPQYASLYSDVWLYADWVADEGHEYGFNAKDTGIDLVAKTQAGEYHAIQAKFFGPEHRLQKSEIDSFFTAMGQKPFTHGTIVSTTNLWSSNAEDALNNRTTPVNRITLLDLENSQIDWSQYAPESAPVLKSKKSLRDHQTAAHDRVVKGLQEADRGKLIMACGTGKTFTSLKIAETVAGAGKRVLFLVPSLSLLSQSLTEWTQDTETPIQAFAVCSDSDVGKKKSKKQRNEDVVQTMVHELCYPATTNAESLAKEIASQHDAEKMTVVFSTYHSIAVLHDAQTDHGMADFDLVICDEAHRTTGATFEDETESAFVRIHDNGFIKAAKRLYMTATPRIYGESAKATAVTDSVTLCSMDDESLYGKTLHTVTFSEAVQFNLLTDYKVVVLAVDEAHVSKRLQDLLADENNQLKVDDAAKIIGCWKALSKQGRAEDDEFHDDSAPMQRAVAFAQVIEPSTGKRHHKVSSKQIAAMFQKVVEAYQEQEDDHNSLTCHVDHVDGSMNASTKGSKLDWLRSAPEPDTCHILSNVRCLSEGVDVPALDAVLFLTPRNSQVDVVQSVGRVMRKSEGKQRGYVVLPVVIPAGKTPSEALDDNKIYRVVWQVLQALRSHDDRFDAMINKMELIGHDPNQMEVIAVTDNVKRKPKKRGKEQAGKGQQTIGKLPEKPSVGKDTQRIMQFNVGEIEKALYAKVVKKCGNRSHWEDWANDIAKIANTHITRIQTIVENPDHTTEKAAFDEFAKELRDDLNDSITDAEVVEMLAQHLITKPVFEALFADYSFAGSNPVSKAMQSVLTVLEAHSLHKEADTLDKFYASVKLRASGIDKAEGKQKIVVELYDKFFRNAFPRLTERLGIVYTPVEVVDFIIHSVNDVLQSEFGQTLGSKGVHIIDPFTGTGTFITRMLQSGLISKDQLEHKYKHEIHANEIVLLAYYIAAINIEAVYHGLMGGEYQPFEGICLTDTFQLYEKEDAFAKLLVDNSGRRKRQKQLDIRVIMSNPPYSAGQKSANDGNANVAYEGLDNRISSTYAKASTATSTKNLMDSYIRAMRWGSDRLGESGVMAYVSNAGWIDGNATDGLRKCLVDEYSSIYMFHLRGDARTQGEQRRKEKGNVFGGGTRTPVVITLFVKNPEAKEHGKIYFHDIGDYLTQEQKLSVIEGLKSVRGITDANGWRQIKPDASNDWLNQRDESFDQFIELGNKKDKHVATLFENYSLGVATGRDKWCYSPSKSSLQDNMKRMIANYNDQLASYKEQRPAPDIDSFIDTDPSRIGWNRNLKDDLAKGKEHRFDPISVCQSAYRPYTDNWLYFGRDLNAMVYQVPKIFPKADASNRVICVTGVGSKAFSTLMTDKLPCLDYVEKSQCFPLYLYDGPAKASDGKDFWGSMRDYERQHAISDKALFHFADSYPDWKFDRTDEAELGAVKDQLFHYIYGLLHSPDYRERFKNNLSKQLPRIPAVKSFADFQAFTNAGYALAGLHVGYENQDPYDVTIETGVDALTDKHYYVKKMKYAKSGKVKDKSTIIYNEFITVKDIPLEAYDYVVNGKSAIDWVMDRQCVKTDKASGIVNDANDYATETMHDARYPLTLLQQVITVSLETMKIVRSLPALDI